MSAEYPSPEWFKDQSYLMPRLLPDGQWIALQSMLYTTGLVVGITPISWRTRFCYETPAEALIASLLWDGTGDPPLNWIKQKPEDRMNPKWLEEARQEIAG